MNIYLYQLYDIRQTITKHLLSKTLQLCNFWVLIQLRFIMGRRSGGLGTAIRIVKEIDRAAKQAARESERVEKARQRALEKTQREYEKARRDEEREQIRKNRLKNIAEKQAIKDALEGAKEEYNIRCKERSELRKSFIKKVLK